MTDNPPNRKQFTLELTEKRRKLLQKLEEKILPRIGKHSKSAAVEESFRLALEYIDKIEDLEEQIQEQKEDWSTKNFELELEE